MHSTYNHCVENRKDFPKLSLFASWTGVMINPQWLELPMSRTNFHGPKDVRAIEVRLYMLGLLSGPLLDHSKILLIENTVTKQSQGLRGDLKPIHRQTTNRNTMSPTAFIDSQASTFWNRLRMVTQATNKRKAKQPAPSSLSRWS